MKSLRKITIRGITSFVKHFMINDFFSDEVANDFHQVDYNQNKSTG